MITLIAARARNGAIGRRGDMPWRIPEDLAFFRRRTEGSAVIMGRRTWESLPAEHRPLRNRFNIVVSARPDVAENVCADVATAVSLARVKGHMRLFGIGGGQVYAAMMPLADRLVITEIDLNIEDADTFFPQISDGNWRCVGEEMLRAEAPQCVVREYLRR